VQYDSAVAFPAGFEDTALLKEYSSILVDLKDSGELALAGMPTGGEPMRPPAGRGTAWARPFVLAVAEQAWL